MKILELAALMFFYLIMVVHAVESPMVEKHIFSAEPDSEEISKPLESLDDQERSKLLKKIDRQLIFTGIIKSSGLQKVLICDKRAKQDDQKCVLNQGDTIMDMTLKEIGQNYIVLSGKGEDVRLNLYKSRKDRPAAPKEPKPNVKTTEKAKSTAAASKTAAAKSRQTKATENKTVNTSDVAKNPFIKALQNAARKKSSGESFGSQGASAKSNPFLEAIKRARQKQQ